VFCVTQNEGFLVENIIYLLACILVIVQFTLVDLIYHVKMVWRVGNTIERNTCILSLLRSELTICYQKEHANGETFLQIPTPPVLNLGCLLTEVYL